MPIPVDHLMNFQFLRLWLAGLLWSQSIFDILFWCFVTVKDKVLCFCSLLFSCCLTSYFILFLNFFLLLSSCFFSPFSSSFYSIAIILFALEMRIRAVKGRREDTSVLYLPNVLPFTLFLCQNHTDAL